MCIEHQYVYTNMHIKDDNQIHKGVLKQILNESLSSIRSINMLCQTPNPFIITIGQKKAFLDHSSPIDQRNPF